MTPEDILAGLDFDAPSEEVVPIESLGDRALVVAYNDVRRELNALNEMHGDPKTDRGRELHSQRAAMIVTLRARGIT